MNEAMEKKESEKKELEILRIDMSFTTNMRIGIRLRGSKNDFEFNISAPEEITWFKETHIVSFEKYTHIEDAPWIITDIDFSCDTLFT